MKKVILFLISAIPTLATAAERDVLCFIDDWTSDVSESSYAAKLPKNHASSGKKPHIFEDSGIGISFKSLGKSHKNIVQVAISDIGDTSTEGRINIISEAKPMDPDPRSGVAPIEANRQPELRLKKSSKFTEVLFTLSPDKPAAYFIIKSSADDDATDERPHVVECRMLEARKSNGKGLGDKNLVTERERKKLLDGEQLDNEPVDAGVVYDPSY